MSMTLDAEQLHRVVRERTPHALVTPTLIGVNAVVFIVMIATGVSSLNPDDIALLNWGANNGPLTTNGQWWRLFTSTFLHAGVLHLAANIPGLVQFGMFTERLVGNVAFLTMYVLTGIVASLASLYVHPGSVNVGASGAIFGIYGFALGSLLSDFWQLAPPALPASVRESGSAIPLGSSLPAAGVGGAHKHHVRRSKGQVLADAFKPLSVNMAAFIAYNILAGLNHPGIDKAAHLGGLAAGSACGWVVGRDVVTAKPPLRQVASVAFAAALLVIGAGVHLRGSPSIRCEDKSPEIRIAGCTAVIQSGHDTSPNTAEAFYQRGNAYDEKGDHDRAMQDFDAAIKIEPRFPQPSYRRGLLYAGKGEHAHAIQDYAGAIRLNPTYLQARMFRGLSYFKTGLHDRAILDFDAVLKVEPKRAVVLYCRGLAKRARPHG